MWFGGEWLGGTGGPWPQPPPPAGEEVRAPQEEARTATSSYSPRGRREGGREKRLSRPRPRADSRDPGDSGMRAGPSPRPSRSTHSATGQQESHSPRPPPSVPPGQGAGAASQRPSAPPARLAGLRCSQSGQVRPVPRDTPSPLPLPRPAPLGLGAAPIGWARPLLAKRPLAIGHGSPAVGRWGWRLVRPILGEAGEPATSGWAPGGPGFSAPGPAQTDRARGCHAHASRQATAAPGKGRSAPERAQLGGSYRVATKRGPGHRRKQALLPFGGGF